MYLFFSNKFVFEGSETKYYYLGGENFKYACEKFESLKNLKIEDVEGLVAFSYSAEHNEQKIKLIKCEKIEIDKSYIKLYFGDIELGQSTCKETFSKLYGLLCRKGIIKSKENSPYISLVDINDYLYLIGVEDVVVTGFIKKIEELKKLRRWLDICNEFSNVFGNIEQVEKSKVWNDAYLLNELTFALSKVTESGYKYIREEQKDYYEIIFFKCCNRCISLEPAIYKHKSILAYHYYNIFMNDKNDKKGYYNKAYELYVKLSQESPQRMKETYRFAKLKEINLERVKRLLQGDFKNKVNEVLDTYRDAILKYKALDENSQKEFRKEYVGSLFGFSIVCIDNYLDYWESFTKKNVLGWDYPKYILTDERENLIDETLRYLKEIIEIFNYDNEDVKFNFRETPNYFHFQYRLAQMEMLKGVFLKIKGSVGQEVKELFLSSKTRINRLFKEADRLRDVRGFKYPNYAKEIKGINCFFLDESDKSHKCFRNAVPYMLYEEANIYYLESNKEKAIECLSKIPSNDKCFNKAQLLKEKIINEI